jgi:hypothetical protein
MSTHTENNRAEAELSDRLTQREAGLEEAWRIINILNMEAMDRGESWPRALDWLNQWEEFNPLRPE